MTVVLAKDMVIESLLISSDMNKSGEISTHKGYTVWMDNLVPQVWVGSWSHRRLIVQGL
jgi:hypothetical protein